LYFFVSVVFVGQALNGIDDGLLGSFQALDSWRAALDYPDNDEIGLLTASAYIAGLVTAPIAGYVADRWGRRWCVRWSALTMLLGATLGTLSGVGGSGYGLFLASRVVIGSGIAFCLMISPVMLQEYAHPKHRTVVAALFDQNYCLGGFIIAWIIFGTSYIENSNWSWRIPYLVQLIPAVYLVVAVQYIPEYVYLLEIENGAAETSER
jgi:SP family sugar:H+ symporter-like MFS transporter